MTSEPSTEEKGRQPPEYYFISYSSVDGRAFALQLADTLEKGPPSFPVWIDGREMRPGYPWPDQLDDAIRDCSGLLFVMTADSVDRHSACTQEWQWALRFKKPVIPLRLDPNAELPFLISDRHYIDFSGDYRQAVAGLRDHLRWLKTPAGRLRELEYRRGQAERELRRADDTKRPRIQDTIKQLNEQIGHLRDISNNPESAKRQTTENIERGIEQDRQGVAPSRPNARVTIINPPLDVNLGHFQDRDAETNLLGSYLRSDPVRIITVTGRAGIGKTALVSRLLQSLERGELPDGGRLDAAGIVYLSPLNGRPATLDNLYTDAIKLLSPDVAERLADLYRNSQLTIEVKMQALASAFTDGLVAVLLDNFEDQIDGETLKLRDPDLDAALRAILTLPHHPLKIIITSRIPPQELIAFQPARQKTIAFTDDDGLPSPYAEELLRQLDADGRLGLRSASDELLGKAREMTRGYPRALEALYAILAADYATSLQELVEQPRHAEVVEALVGQAFSRLDVTAQQVMQVLAVFGKPVTPTAVDFVFQPYLPAISSGPILSRLVNMRLVRKEEKRCYLHPADLEYALSRVPEGDTDTELESSELQFTLPALRQRAADYYVQIRKPPEEWKTLADLQPQLDEFDLRCEAQDYPAALGVLSTIDFDYLLLWGHWRLLAELYQRLQGRVGKPYDEAALLTGLGNCYSDLGETRRAIDYYEQALAIAREIGDRQAEGADLMGLGNCYQSLGEIRRAIEYYEQALAIAREIGDRQAEGADLGNLGNCYQSLGEIRRAIEYYEQALAIAREIGDRQAEGVALTGLGKCYSNLGETRRAIDYYEQALVIDREIGDRPGEVIDLRNLGRSYSALGDTERAELIFKQAAAIERELDA